MAKDNMNRTHLCAIVAANINEGHGWTSPLGNGYILPERVAEVLDGTATTSHPMTQEITAEIRKVAPNAEIKQR